MTVKPLMKNAKYRLKGIDVIRASFQPTQCFGFYEFFKLYKNRAAFGLVRLKEYIR